MNARMSDVPQSMNDGFVRAINAEMRARGFTQSALVKKLNGAPHQSTLSGYLTQNYKIRTVMTLALVERIADALGIEPLELAIKAAERRYQPLADDEVAQ